MSTFDEALDHIRKDRDLGLDYELREVKRWVVHCVYCGHIVIGDTPKTDKAWQALRVSLEGRRCRNQNCYINGGTETRKMLEL